MNHSSHFSLWTSLLSWILATLVSFGCIIFGVGVLAQGQKSVPQPIVVDGIKLFNVSDSGEFNAQQRAQEANTIIREKINNSARDVPIKVEIDTGRGLPVILVDGSHLLSVTSNDAPKGRSVQEQAIVWRRQLQQAIERAQYERTANYLIRATLFSLAILGLTFFINFRLGRLWHRWVEPLFEQHIDDTAVSTPGQPLTQITEPQVNPKLFSSVLIGLLKGIIWLISLTYISRIFPKSRNFSRELIDIIVSTLIADLFSLGGRGYSVLDLVILLLVLTVLVLSSSTVKRLLQTRLLSLTGLNRSAQETIALIANYFLIFIGTIVVLQLWGLDISSLTVFAGVLGVGIGLGIQGIAKEFISGLVLIFERPIQVGDFVEVGGLMGTVERISVRSTEIRTLDQVSVILPNSRFLESEVINWSHASPISRLKLPIGVAYGSDLNLVKNALLDAAKEHKEILSHPAPRVFFVEFADSCLKFQLLVWINRPHKQFQIKSDLYFIIDSIFRKRGIEIPFPQRDLHLSSGSLPISLSPDLLNSLRDLSTSLASWIKSQQQPPK